MGPAFSLPPSFVSLVVTGGTWPGGLQPLELLMVPWVSWGVKLALSDLRLAEVVGEFSVSCKVLFLKRKVKMFMLWKVKRSLLI